MSSGLDRGRAQDAPCGTVAIAPAGKARRHEGDDVRAAGVRVAHVSGGASYGRSGDPEGWEPVSVDLSVATGDRVYAARGACLDLHASAFEIHLASGAGLEVISLTEEVKRFYVWGGSSWFLVRELQPSESFGVDTPTASVTFERAGKYRIDGIQCPAHDPPLLRSLDTGGSGVETLPCRARDQVLLFRPRQSH